MLNMSSIMPIITSSVNRKDQQDITPVIPPKRTKFSELIVAEQIIW